MKQTMNVMKDERQRKFFAVLPIIVLPFLTLLFWSLGGGSENVQAQTAGKAGMNMALPDANFGNDKPQDKMSYYNQAALDSAKRLELLKNDPNYIPEATVQDTTILNMAGEYTGAFPSTHSKYADPNEAKIYQRINQLNSAINEKSQLKEPPMVNGLNVSQGRNSKYQMYRLEQLVNTGGGAQEPDPEMQQLSGMLEKILDIQHPDRVQEKIKENSAKRRGRVFAVGGYKAVDPISLITPGSDFNSLASFSIPNTSGNGFYSLNEKPVEDTQNSIQAIVHETQTLVSGSTIKLRLANDIYINGILIPKETFLFGVVSLNGDRLTAKVNNIRYLNYLFPVELTVYDLDGLEGIYIPGSISRTVAKESADRSIQDIGLNSYDPSWQMQAAGAGVEAAKSLFSKKVKLIKVSIIAGYQVLLRDEKQKLNDN
jgi:conjugative transposon TraM protein